MLPRPKAEMLGRRAGTFLGQRFAEPFLAAFERVLASGRPESIEYDMEIAGERRWFLGRINRIVDASGQGAPSARAAGLDLSVIGAGGGVSPAAWFAIGASLVALAAIVAMQRRPSRVNPW